STPAGYNEVGEYGDDDDDAEGTPCGCRMNVSAPMRRASSRRCSGYSKRPMRSAKRMRRWPDKRRQRRSARPQLQPRRKQGLRLSKLKKSDWPLFRQRRSARPQLQPRRKQGLRLSKKERLAAVQAEEEHKAKVEAEAQRKAKAEAEAKRKAK